MAQDNVKAVIEALLFASEKPLTIEQIKNVLGNFEATQVRAKVEELKNDYQQAAGGMRITEIAGGFQMITSPDFASFLKKLYKERHADRLSKPALETLAIIAYKQPVTRVEIESLRSVNIDGVMKSLLERSLIRITGRKKAPGRPHVFGTTRQFLEYFGLKSLDELPKIEELSSIMEKKEESIRAEIKTEMEPAMNFPTGLESPKNEGDKEGKEPMAEETTDGTKKAA